MNSSTKTRGRLIASITAATATVLAMLVMAPAANAAEGAADPAPRVEISAEEQANLDALLAASDNSGDVAVFDIDQALALGADATATQEYAASFVEAGGTLAPTESSSAADVAKGTEAGAMALAACRGKNGFTGYYWFGSQTAMNSCNTQALINGITLAAAGGGTYAAASALTVAGLPAAAVVGVIAGILGIGVAFLNICKDTSSVNAIYLNGGVAGVVPPSCWAQ
ncbi:hypothetical protein [Yonghaparkia sp. Root332]|uniref:hypothetical protein n=1 Tax=Yonghaparkia sp. Root332 TaxID=1736516 RepID=UPI000A8E101E|nr:hypothetical protein [Yonghaparkia sp. Root332]